MENQGLFFVQANISLVQLSLVKVLPPILTWQNSVQTGICVAALNIISLILCYMKMNFLYVITNFLFFYLITSFLYVKLLKFLNKEQQNSLNIQFFQSRQEDKQEDDYYIVSKEKMQEVVAFIISKINIIYTKIKRCEISNNYYTEILTLGTLYLIAIIGKYFSLFTLIWLGFNVLMGIAFCETVLKIDVKEKSAPLIGQQYYWLIQIDILEKSKAYKNLLVQKIPKHSEEKLE